LSFCVFFFLTLIHFRFWFRFWFWFVLWVKSVYFSLWSHQRFQVNSVGSKLGQWLKPCLVCHCFDKRNFSLRSCLANIHLALFWQFHSKGKWKLAKQGLKKTTFFLQFFFFCKWSKILKIILVFFLKSKIFWHVLKMLHGFYNKSVKFQRILVYISKILKNYFWQENILFTFNIRIKNL